MTTWGPTPQDVVDLQTMGMNAWLAAQFAQPPARGPIPTAPPKAWRACRPPFQRRSYRQRSASPARGSSPWRRSWWFPPSTNHVSSRWWRTSDCWATTLSTRTATRSAAMTLNPAMGDYLDMVNNAKATGHHVGQRELRARVHAALHAGAGAAGLRTATPVMVNGGTVPEYDQATVAAMAKVMTGWTYGETPGYASLWTNMPYYFDPMIAFENYHDTTAKTLNFPIPCTIPAGGTAESDLSAAFDCVFQQTNVAPNVSFRLIQHFVESSPSPAYVGRVASAFQTSAGSLQSVITAILTDPEAQTPGTGKLTEPILYATNLLRALNATHHRSRRAYRPEHRHGADPAHARRLSSASSRRST